MQMLKTLFNRARPTLLVLGAICITVGCAGLPSGGRLVDESYKLGLKSEAANDCKAAIPFFDEAINNFESFGTWLRQMQFLSQYKVDDGVSLARDSDFMQHRALRHRANCKKVLGDIAGQQADLAFAEKQKPKDMAMLNEIIEGQPVRKSVSAGANQPTEDVRHCLTASYENTCKQTVELRAVGSGQCSGSVRRIIEPGRMATVGLGCILSDVTVRIVQ